MRILARTSAALERILEVAVVSMIVGMTAVVVIAVIYRKAGASLSWYDEVASIMLAWLTYYGACLAALKRSHIGFDGIVRAVPPRWRLICVVVAEFFVIAFFTILAWTGWIVLEVLEGDTLVSLPDISVQITQSVIPFGAMLFIVCELVSLPLYWQRLGAKLEEDPPSSGTAYSGSSAA